MADEVIHCEFIEQGLRFTGEGFETLVYSGFQRVLTVSTEGVRLIHR